MFHEVVSGTFVNTFVPISVVSDSDYILCYHDNKILLKQTGENFDLPAKGDIMGRFDESLAVFLFSLNSVKCFLVPEISGEYSGFMWKEIFDLRTLQNKEIAWLGALGHHLYTWYQANKYCGKCGTKTELKKDERAIHCPSCGNTIYPKISLAIIVGITCGDKILLARAVNFRSKFYSLIAGYADAGESLEQALVREVREEVGIEVKNIRYYKSQPWPFSGSLMVGFWAEADDTQPVKIDPREIVDAGWYSRGNLPVHPNTISIAGEMLEAFEKGEF